MKKYEVEGHVPSYLPEGRNWKLVWNDEFDGPELDTSKWEFRLNFWGKRFAAYTDEGITFDGNSNILLHAYFHSFRKLNFQFFYIRFSHVFHQLFYFVILHYFSSSYFFNMILALCPPNPKEFDITTFKFALLNSFGTISKSHSSSGTL